MHGPLVQNGPSHTHQVSESGLVFDLETHLWLQKLYDAWSCNAPASTFASIRDSLLDQLEHLDNRICTLSSFAKIVCVHGAPEADEASKWAQLFSLADSIKSRNKANAATERKRKYNETNRLRNLALVAAFWSPRIVFHYGWNNSSQVQMNMLRACATRYPRFSAEFRPRLNAVLLARHRRGIQDYKTKTLNEAPLQPHRDFNLGTLASIVPDEDLESEWVTNTDGRLLVDVGAGTTLRDARPSHYHSYLLQRDCFGLLIARGEIVASPTVQTPANAPLADEVAANTESLSNPALPTHAHSSSSPPFCEPSSWNFESQFELFFNLPTPPLWSPSPAADPHASSEPLLAGQRHDEAIAAAMGAAMQQNCAPQMHVPWPCRVTGNEWQESEPLLSFSTVRQDNADDWMSVDILDEDAEVLFLTSAEAMKAAHAGEIFTKPLVIKECFSDAGMHTMNQLTRLWASATDLAAHAPEYAGAAAINLQNITRSHRPLITMLPRFCLLERLFQRIARKEARHLTHPTSFTTLSPEGAFSAPRLVASAGMWMRNLEGIKYVSFVPDKAVLAESAVISDMGMAWDPKENQRYVLLEQDDVFFIPAGLRVIYTIYSPTQGVMEGDFFWDDWTVLSTLFAAESMHSHRLSQEDPIYSALPTLTTAIELLIAQEPDNFRGSQPRDDFLFAFQSIVSKIRQYTSGSLGA